MSHGPCHQEYYNLAREACIKYCIAWTKYSKRTRIVTEAFRGEARAGREERVVNFKDGEHCAKKDIKMPIEQECFCECEISWNQADVAYQRGKIG